MPRGTHLPRGKELRLRLGRLRRGPRARAHPVLALPMQGALALVPISAGSSETAPVQRAGESGSRTMFSIAFKPRTEATTQTRVGQIGFIGHSPSKELSRSDLEEMVHYWAECGKVDTEKTGAPPRRMGLHYVEGRMHYLVLERFVQTVMGEDALPALEQEMREHHAALQTSKNAFVLSDFDQEPNSETGDRRVAAFHHFPTMNKLRGILGCWMQQDSLVADVLHWDPASTMRSPEDHPVHGFCAGVRIGTPGAGLSPALDFDTAFEKTEIEFNPGDVYFLVSEVMKFMDEPSERLGLPSIMESQAAADAIEPVNNGPPPAEPVEPAEPAEPSEAGSSGLVGMQAPSSDEGSEEDKQEHTRPNTAIKKGKKGKKMVRRSRFMR